MHMTHDDRHVCSDACNRDLSGDNYAGWDGCHETEFTRFCDNCGVVIPGIETTYAYAEQPCECQRNNMVVNRFLTADGEKCEHGNWIQLPMAYLSERV